MSKKVLAAVLLAVAGSAQAATTVLDFESVDLVAIPTDYGGLTWIQDAWGMGPQDWPYNASSGIGVASFNWTKPQENSLIGFNEAVLFDGAFFAGVEFAALTVHLWLGGTEIHTSDVIVPTPTPTFYSFSHVGLVDAVSFSAEMPGYWVMDEFTFTLGVPEPAAGLLFAAGLLACGVARRASKA